MGGALFTFSRFVFVVGGVSILTGCPAAPPQTPVAMEDPTLNTSPIVMASGTEMRSLRPMLDHQRERLREIIDLAERRELHEGGPHMLRACKAESRNLDQIEARVEDITRMGGGSEREVDALGDELRRFSSRLDSLASALR